MLDHVGFKVADLKVSQAFYTRALVPLSITLVLEVTAEQTGAEAHAGFGVNPKAFFWIGSGGRSSAATHVAFTTQSRAQVEAFYRAALAAGGRDNGGPGFRPHYHANYYAAFVLDPDGNNIEAVCHQAE